LRDIVVHFVLAGESGTEIIPPLLLGQLPPSHPELSTIGSGSYSQVPQAVVLGGAFDDESVAALRDAVSRVAGTRKVPWIRQDKEKTKIPVMSPGYIPDVIARSKEAVTKLAKEGKLDGTYDGLEYY